MDATRLRWVAIATTGVVLAAASAHMLELPNKLRLDGPLWLAVQQNVYRGWGPMIGPFEILSIASSWLLAVRSRGMRQLSVPSGFAAVCMTLALVVFATVVAPVNRAFAGWTPATLPSDWPIWRLRWELGHALGFVFTLCAFVALIRTALLSHPIRRRPTAAARSTPVRST